MGENDLKYEHLGPGMDYTRISRFHYIWYLWIFDRQKNIQLLNIIVGGIGILRRRRGDTPVCVASLVVAHDTSVWTCVWWQRMSQRRNADNVLVPLSASPFDIFPPPKSRSEAEAHNELRDVTLWNTGAFAKVSQTEALTAKTRCTQFYQYTLQRVLLFPLVSSRQRLCARDSCYSLSVHYLKRKKVRKIHLM